MKAYHSIVQFPLVVFLLATLDVPVAGQSDPFVNLNFEDADPSDLEQLSYSGPEAVRTGIGKSSDLLPGWELRFGNGKPASKLNYNLSPTVGPWLVSRPYASRTSGLPPLDWFLHGDIALIVEGTAGQSYELIQRGDIPEGAKSLDWTYLGRDDYIQFSINGDPITRQTDLSALAGQNVKLRIVFGSGYLDYIHFVPAEKPALSVAMEGVAQKLEVSFTAGSGYFTVESSSDLRSWTPLWTVYREFGTAKVGEVTPGAGRLFLRVVEPVGGGTVRLNNYDFELQEGPPVTIHCQGSGPNAGDGYVAQLYAGQTAESLVPVGPPVGFEFEGYFGYYPGPVRTIPFIPPGDIGYFQVRVWNKQNGATWEEAAQSVGLKGQSNIFTVRTGGVGDPPSLSAPLAGLESFDLCPE